MLQLFIQPMNLVSKDENGAAEKCNELKLNYWFMLSPCSFLDFRVTTWRLFILSYPALQHLSNKPEVPGSRSCGEGATFSKVSVTNVVLLWYGLHHHVFITGTVMWTAQTWNDFTHFCPAHKHTHLILGQKWLKQDFWSRCKQIPSDFPSLSCAHYTEWPHLNNGFFPRITRNRNWFWNNLKVEIKGCVSKDPPKIEIDPES